jgi:hypothetical protein
MTQFPYRFSGWATAVRMVDENRCALYRKINCVGPRKEYAYFNVTKCAHLLGCDGPTPVKGAIPTVEKLSKLQKEAT